MAQVVVFSLKECPHCKNAKSVLEQQGMDFVEISLTDYPEKRTDMLQLADRLTVPQVFINGHHIGGNSELVSLRDSGELAPLLRKQPHERVSDARLRRPDYAPKPVDIPTAPEEEVFYLGGTRVTYSDISNILLEGVEVKDRRKQFGLQTYKKCFKGSKLTGFLLAHFQLRNREVAAEVGQQLLQAGLFGPVDGSGSGFEDSDELYRFQKHESGMFNALNITRNWCVADGCLSDPPSNPLGLLKRLKNQLSEVVKSHTSADGLVDYLSLGQDTGFAQFELAAAELQLVNLSSMSSTLRRAFVINLYNMIVPHAFGRVGVPSHDLARVSFFDGVRYHLGDEFYSLNDLENGVLRGNRTAPYHLRRPFQAGDSRLSAVEDVDHRIHFALNCGAKACPPVKWFTPEALDEELRIVAMAWVEQDDNVRIDLDTHTLWLSKIVQWYAADFGNDNVEIAETLLGHLRGEKKLKMKALLHSNFTIKHVPYDWTTNSSKAKDYRKICPSCFFTGGA